MARAEAGERIDEPLDQVAELQRRIDSAPAETLEDAVVKLRRLGAYVEEGQPARLLAGAFFISPGSAPTLSEKEIQLAAEEKILKHGADAFAEAEIEISTLNARGEFSRAGSWMLVCQRIRKLQAFNDYGKGPQKKRHAIRIALH